MFFVLYEILNGFVVRYGVIELYGGSRYGSLWSFGVF